MKVRSTRREKDLGGTQGEGPREGHVLNKTDKPRGRSRKRHSLKVNFNNVPQKKEGLTTKEGERRGKNTR